MPSGLEVYNNDNVLVIDSDYKNMRLAQKLTVTPSGSGAFFSKRATVNLPSASPVVAYYCTQNCLVNVVLVGSTWTAYVENEGYPVTLYIFDLAYPTGSNSGFEVFNSAGQLVFSANEKYMKVRGNLSYDYATAAQWSSGNNYRDMTFTAGQMIATVASSNARLDNVGPGSDVTKYSLIILSSFTQNIAINTVRCCYNIVRVYDNISTFPVQDESVANLTFIDVTGL